MVTRRRALNIAVVGATGAVGSEMLRVLEQRRFPVKHMTLLASPRSAGKRMPWNGTMHTVQRLTAKAFDGIDLALFSAGGVRSAQFAPEAAKRGAIVIDNSSAFRMDPTVPLVVPEVNPQALKRHQGIIANPNCSTIILVVALKPLHDTARLRRVIVTTCQSVSGAGAQAMQQLLAETRALLSRVSPRLGAQQSAALVQHGSHARVQIMPRVLPDQIAWNVLPHIDQFVKDDYTKEEWKMMHETRKIMGLPKLAVNVTCVRVPVLVGHSESVTIECARTLRPATARAALQRAPGVRVVDAPAQSRYPLPIDVASTDEVLVGRIRRDLSHPRGLTMWIVGDNLRKGAATNAVQIAELLS